MEVRGYMSRQIAKSVRVDRQISECVDRWVSGCMCSNAWVARSRELVVGSPWCR